VGGEEPKYTMARKPDPLNIIQYSLRERIEKDLACNKFVNEGGGEWGMGRGGQG
jgi:hypothetical protein